jgi:hypothetical protein
MCRSLRTLTKWSSTHMHSVSRQLAVLGLRQATLRVAIVWLGDLLSRHLHQEAAMMDPASSSFSLSMLCRWALILGSNCPWQGTKQQITGNVRGQILALGPISVRRNGFLRQRSVKVSFALSDSNSRRIAGQLKMATLHTIHDGGRGSSPSGVIVQLSTQSLKVLHNLC